MKVENFTNESYLGLARFADDSYFDIGRVLAHLVLRFDHILSSMRSLSLQYEEFGIVIDIVDTYRVV